MRKILFIFAAVLLGSIGLHAGNTITYTASEKLPGYNGSLNVGATTFGPAITSHEFSNGTGTIICNGEITKIGDNAFRGVIPRLTSIEIPSSVKTIGNYAFCGSWLFSIEIPDSVTSIGMEAFGGCNDLESITIGESIKEILWGAFWNCYSLRTIYCYAPIPPIQDVKTFDGVPHDASVYVFDAEAYQRVWTQLPASCFKPIPAEVDGIKYEFFNGSKARVVANEGGYTGNIAIPEQVVYRNMTFTVTEIGENAFKNCTGLTSVTIPNTITEIGQSAFEGCNNLTSVTIPTSVKEIGAWAFKNCTQLSNLQFADREITDAINIGIYAFENLALEEVIIPDWLAVIPEGLFFNNTKLKGIYLHEGVNTIGYRPFGACPFEYIISMSQTPPALAEGAFEGHDKDANVIVYVPSMDAVEAYQNSDWNKYFINSNFITNNTYRITSSSTAELVGVIPEEKIIAIPTMVAISERFYMVTGIGNNAFKDNTLLESLSLPPTIQYIGNSAFSGCIQLKQTNSRFWEDLQTIGDSAFYGCSALDSIVIPEAVQTIGKSAFMECKNLTSISLPTGLKNIPDECFHKCPLGMEIIVPEGVETIGKYAFEGNSETRMDAKSITLPSTLKEINFAAFYLHDGLKTITCRALIPPTLTEQAFASKEFQEQQITVYVPNRDVMAAYRDDKNQWGSDIYQFQFSDLMAKENKEYLYIVAGDNEEAKAIADAYCDSIDNANSSQNVQDFTNDALVQIEKLTLKQYKENLIKALNSLAGKNSEATQIVKQYESQILNAYFRQEAERLFKEAEKKIKDIFALIDLKNEYCKQLNARAGKDPDLQKVAADYGALIQLAETKEQADALYAKAQIRITINQSIKEDWKGGTVKKGSLNCTTTKGYIDNH